MTTTPNSLITPQTIKNAILRLNNASGTTAQTLYTAAGDGIMIDELMATSTDTATAYLIQLFAVISATNYLLGTINVPANSGANGTVAAVNLLNTTLIPGLATDAYGNPVLILDSGTGLAAKSTTTITNTAGFEIDIFLAGAKL